MAVKTVLEDQAASALAAEAGVLEPTASAVPVTAVAG
jgi:hypothetical protein